MYQASRLRPSSGNESRINQSLVTSSPTREFMSPIEFGPKIPALPPADIAHKLSFLIGSEGQTQAFVFANRPVPSPARVEIGFRRPAHADELFVCDSDHVKCEVV